MLLNVLLMDLLNALLIDALNKLLKVSLVVSLVVSLLHLLLLQSFLFMNSTMKLILTKLLLLQHFLNVVAERTSKMASNRRTEEICISNVCIDANNTAQAPKRTAALWNASHIIHGSFHQNDTRFSVLSRGFQCTCNE